MELPNKCPHCGKDIAYTDFNSYEHIRIYCCQHCNKRIVAIYDKDVFYEIPGTDQLYPAPNLKLQGFFPYTIVSELPAEFIKTFPDANKIYKAALSNKALGFTTLASAGIRIALDLFVWDYLIKIVGKTEDEIKKLNLNDKIKLMPFSKEEKLCAHILRVFGNNNVHPFKDYDCTLDEAIIIFEYLATSISKDLDMKKLFQKLAPKDVMPKTV